MLQAAPERSFLKTIVFINNDAGAKRARREAAEGEERQNQRSEASLDFLSESSGDGLQEEAAAVGDGAMKNLLSQIIKYILNKYIRKKMAQQVLSH